MASIPNQWELNDMADWQSERRVRDDRLKAGSKFAKGKIVAPNDATALLEAVVRPGDRICLEGDNQKQADFLAACLAKADSKVLHDLHVVQSGIVLPEHLDLFEKGIARKLDFSFSGPQSENLARVLKSGKIELGAIHTYIELFGRYFIDLTPHVALTVARSADRDGNLYMGPNTEDSPVVIEATAFKQGIVIAQVDKVVDKLPRVDIPGDRIDYVVETPKPFYIEPLLPTYADKLGLKGKIATHFALNPHPTLIPAIESGWVKQIHSFGSEVGMDDYMRARPDIYFTGRDGSMGSNRMFCQVAGLYAVDLFIGATLQIDLNGNSSTVTTDRIAGFGGAPNMGSDARGRRHSTEPWLKAGREATDGNSEIVRGRKLVVQLVETFSEKMVPVFVEKLDCVELAEKLKLDLAPVMIYGDDVTHIVSEEGIANLLLCRTTEEREQAIRGIAG